MRGLINRDNPPRYSVWCAWQRAMRRACLRADVAVIAWLLAAREGWE